MRVKYCIEHDFFPSSKGMFPLRNAVYERLFLSTGFLQLELQGGGVVIIKPVEPNQVLNRVHTTCWEGSCRQFSNTQHKKHWRCSSIHKMEKACISNLWLFSKTWGLDQVVRIVRTHLRIHYLTITIGKLATVLVRGTCISLHICQLNSNK